MDVSEVWQNNIATEKISNLLFLNDLKGSLSAQYSGNYSQHYPPHGFFTVWSTVYAQNERYPYQIINTLSAKSANPYTHDKARVIHQVALEWSGLVMTAGS